MHTGQCDVLVMAFVIGIGRWCFQSETDTGDVKKSQVKNYFQNDIILPRWRIRYIFFPRY
jgi:hypothetical protein